MQENKSKEQDKEYFVRNRAYGSATKHRTVDIVPSLWAASVVWEPFLAKHQGKLLEPQALYHFLLQKDGKGKRKAFYNIGPLTAYLLVADYVYAGLVSPPSAQDIAFFICSIDLGAIQALVQLRLLPSGAQVEDCVEAVEQIYQYLDQQMEEEVKARMPLDYILIEHTLCKITRLKVTAESINK